MTSRGTFDKMILGFRISDEDELLGLLEVFITVTIIVVITSRKIFSFF